MDYKEFLENKIYNLPEDTLGDKIRKIRYINKISQKEFSTLVGCGDYTIWAWENDKFKPNIKYRKKIIQVFNLSENYFD